MKKTERFAAVIAVALICVGTGMALQIYWGYRKGRDEYREIRKKYIVDAQQTEEQDSAAEDEPGPENSDAEVFAGVMSIPKDSPDRIQIDWNALRAAYTDIVAWIELPAVGLSYPVVQAEDNDYYLHRSPDKEYLYAGSIFMDYHNSSALQNYNTIIYGHNMRDGSMFAKLKEYSDQETVDSCPYFWLYTPDEDFLYRIFSVHTAAVGSDTYIVRFADNGSYVDWLENMQKSSVIKTEIELQPGSQVVTLSTCTGDTSARQVAQGVMVWKGK